MSPTSARIREVGPRDGLQAEHEFVPTATKIALINALSRTGVSTVQATSFVHPRAVPQLADAGEVMAGIDRVPGVTYSVLVPNVRGAERALDAGADEWDLMLSASDSHSRSNANRNTWEALERLKPVIALGLENSVSLVGGLATALGCPFEGKVPYSRVHDVVGAYRDLGVRKLSIADTVGVADPALVRDTMSRLHADFPDCSFLLHLHNTRGMALANLLVGLDAGVTEFDASVGGLGGCPFAPGASGNVATEDVVHMLQLMGIDTGVDLEAMLELARHMVPEAVGHVADSSVARAGVSWDLHPAPEKQQLA
ncbi:hydroxymethylglutaryl-CoA lyase [Spelaeicoccus albus]|uniref:Hydroxymethylglutaryl-CoA lyase n=1 Tax=Spelaeicoccus albus TaxID=1280376 RepID=A0A7Z0ABK9_9MICO|nr:hydroxymethylglutaryl-CoA lyase [Spelaeicoccus albus]NYI67125.1 hydroxymethylglutaryl-CoA lyase [Spelaeicoccus albus]